MALSGFGIARSRRCEPQVKSFGLSEKMPGIHLVPLHDQAKTDAARIPPPVGSSRADTPLRAAQPAGFPPAWKLPLLGFPSRPAASFDIGNDARLYDEGQGNALTIWDRRALLIGLKDAASGMKWPRRLRLPQLFKTCLGLKPNKPLANRRLEALRMFAFEQASGVRVHDSSAIAELHLDLQGQAKAFCDGYLSTQAQTCFPASANVRPGSILPDAKKHSERREHASD